MTQLKNDALNECVLVVNHSQFVTKMRGDLTLLIVGLTWQVVIGNDCLPLSQCPPLMAMLETENDLPEHITKNEVFEHLRQLGCGFNGKEPKVFCPPMIEAIESKIFFL